MQGNCYLKQGKYSAAENIFKKVRAHTEVDYYPTLTIVFQVLHTVQVGEVGQSVSQEASQWVQGSTPRSPIGRNKEGAYLDKGGWHQANPPQR